jgi:hypothetical protein
MLLGGKYSEPKQVVRAILVTCDFPPVKKKKKLVTSHYYWSGQFAEALMDYYLVTYSFRLRTSVLPIFLESQTFSTLTKFL